MSFGRLALSAGTPVNALRKRRSCSSLAIPHHRRLWFEFTRSASLVKFCDPFAATAANNWSLQWRAIAAEGRGLLIYEQQEGRGIGLMAKLQAYALQDEGLDTIAANHALGFEADCRDFMLPAAILNHLGIREIRLLSNNPDKRRALAKAGIAVIEQIPCEASPGSYSMGYLGTKKHRMGHTLTLV